MTPIAIIELSCLIMLFLGGVGWWLRVRNHVPPGEYPPGFGPTSVMRGPKETRWWHYAGREGDKEIWVPMDEVLTKDEIAEQQKSGRYW
jgi:hypothetical protein